MFLIPLLSLAGPTSTAVAARLSELAHAVEDASESAQRAEARFDPAADNDSDPASLSLSFGLDETPPPPPRAAPLPDTAKGGEIESGKGGEFMGVEMAEDGRARLRRAPVAQAWDASSAVGSVDVASANAGVVAAALRAVAQVEASEAQTQQLDGMDVAVMQERSHELSMLNQELRGLAELYSDMAKLLAEDGESLEAVQEQTEKAAVRTREGTRRVLKAAKLASYSAPLVGGLLGGVMMGPVGLVLGVKTGMTMGALAAGGTAGGVMVGKMSTMARNFFIDKDGERVDEQQAAAEERKVQAKIRDGESSRV